MPYPTHITHHTQSGDPAHAGTQAFNSLFSLIYGDLEHIAHMLMKNERRDHTLETQGLMHEAYTRLLASYSESQTLVQLGPDDLRSLTAVVMRRILVDYARKRKARITTQDGYRHHIEACYELVSGVIIDLITLDEALVELETLDRGKARIVEMRFFGAMPMAKIAAVLDRPLRSVERDWTFARAWLCSRLQRDTRA